jgi:hypothetical protein
VSRPGPEIVRDHLRRTHRLEVGPLTPAEILSVVRTVEPLDSDFLFEVRGQGPDGKAGNPGPFRKFVPRSDGAADRHRERGTTLTITATLPSYCLKAPSQVSVTLADEDLQRLGMAGSGKQVPHQIMGSTLRAHYTTTEDDSAGKGLVITRCGDLGGDGLGTFEILR